MSQGIITLENVSKDFKSDFWKKSVRALHQVTFGIQAGDVFGLIGPNGAGKTTIIKILMGLVKPSQGVALVRGQATTDILAKRHLGYLPEAAYYYDFLATEEILDFYGRLFGLSRKERARKTDELLELVGLADRRGVRLRQFSKGMLQRIGIAQALVNDPDLVVFDEPMSGLDPIGRKEVRDIIIRLAEQKKTILFSSHILSDVEAICEKVAILIKGNLRACGPIQELVRPQVKNVEISFQSENLAKFQSPWKGEGEVRVTPDRVVIRIEKPDQAAEIIRVGLAQDLKLLSVVPQKETLEDIFIQQAGS